MRPSRSLITAAHSEVLLFIVFSLISYLPQARIIVLKLACRFVACVRGDLACAGNTCHSRFRHDVGSVLADDTRPQTWQAQFIHHLTTPSKKMNPLRLIRGTSTAQTSRTCNKLSASPIHQLHLPLLNRHFTSTKTANMPTYIVSRFPLFMVLSSITSAVADIRCFTRLLSRTRLPTSRSPRKLPSAAHHGIICNYPNTREQHQAAG